MLENFASNEVPVEESQSNQADSASYRAFLTSDVISSTGLVTSLPSGRLSRLLLSSRPVLIGARNPRSLSSATRAGETDFYQPWTGFRL